MEIMEIVNSLDFVIFLVVGVVIGWLAGQAVKDRSYGIGGNIVIAVTGSLVSGFIFDWLDFMNIGDIADPAIAASVGAVVFLTLAALARHPKNNES